MSRERSQNQASKAAQSRDQDLTDSPTLLCLTMSEPLALPPLQGTV